MRYSFISDIAAHELKPLFLVGASITSLTFLSTISNVHKFRLLAYTENHSRVRGIASMLSVFAGFVAATSLILMAVLDTFRFHPGHAVLLLACLGGVGICSFLAIVVWVDQILVPGRLRKWYASHLHLVREGMTLTSKRCIANAAIVLAASGVSVTFWVMLRRENWQLAGTLEWIAAFLGAMWIFTFMGILRYVNGVSPLLSTID